MAALIGVEAGVNVSVDTKKIVEDAKVVASTANTSISYSIPPSGRDCTAVKAADTVVSGATSVATSVAKDAGKAIDKAGKGIKKAFKF